MAVHQLYVAAKACNHHEPWQRRVAQLAWERKLLAICRPFVADPSAVQGKLCRRIERHIKELFVFVAEPDVPADNNPAERSLRHLVISRKVSGGTRSEQWHRAQDDAGIHLRHLARPRSKSSRRLPSAARFPSTLNCYELRSVRDCHYTLVTQGAGGPPYAHAMSHTGRASFADHATQAGAPRV